MGASYAKITGSPVSSKDSDWNDRIKSLERQEVTSMKPERAFRNLTKRAGRPAGWVSNFSRNCTRVNDKHFLSVRMKKLLICNCTPVPWSSPQSFDTGPLGTHRTPLGFRESTWYSSIPPLFNLREWRSSWSFRGECLEGRQNTKICILRNFFSFSLKRRFFLHNVVVCSTSPSRPQGLSTHTSVVPSRVETTDNPRHVRTRPRHYPGTRQTPTHLTSHKYKEVSSFSGGLSAELMVVKGVQNVPFFSHEKEGLTQRICLDWRQRASYQTP